MALTVFLIVFLIAFLLRFEVIAEAVSKVTGIDKDVIMNTAGDVMLVTIGLAFVALAVSFAAVPVLGVLLAITAAALLIYAVVSIWNRKSTEGKISGLDTNG